MKSTFRKLFYLYFLKVAKSYTGRSFHDTCSAALVSALFQFLCILINWYCTTDMRESFGLVNQELASQGKSSQHLSPRMGQRRSYHPMMTMSNPMMISMAGHGVERRIIGLRMHASFLWSFIRRPPSHTWRMQCQSLWGGLCQIVEMAWNLCTDAFCE